MVNKRSRFYEEEQITDELIENSKKDYFDDLYTMVMIIYAENIMKMVLIHYTEIQYKRK